MASTTSSFCGARVAAKAAVRPAASRAQVVCRADMRKQVAAGVAAAVFLFAQPQMAQASLTEDLLAKSAANKALNDKKRLATSGANFARSRTVTDGTCGFPNNWVGCQNAAERGNVKYLTDDMKLECQGKDTTKFACASKTNGSLPSFFGV